MRRLPAIQRIVRRLRRDKRVYWAPYVGGEVCPIYGCCAGKGYAHCGACEALPCRIYFETRDPSMSEAEHEAGVYERAERLRGL